MSTLLSKIKKTGLGGNRDLNVVQFWGGKKSGSMLQISQGLGLELNEPGFIHVTEKDARQLIKVIEKWMEE